MKVKVEHFAMALALTVAVVAFAMLAVVLFDRPAPRKRDSSDGEPLVARIKSQKTNPSKRHERRIVTGGQKTCPVDRLAKEDRAAGKSSEAGIDDDALMDKVVSGLLAELSSAMGRKDKNRTLDLVNKLCSLNYGGTSVGGGSLGGRAYMVKSKILEAASTLGLEGLGSVLDLLGDADPGIAKSATDLLFESLQEISLGDHDRAEIVVAASEELTDTDTLTRLFQEFIMMRHSVGVDAMTQIYNTGTQEAKSLISSSMSAFTGDVTITKPEQLVEWLENNPDSRYDNWFYGSRIPKAKVK